MHTHTHIHTSHITHHTHTHPHITHHTLTHSHITHTQVTGIEGNFRQTCNNVMRVLRENKDSVMAVLEAFVYDPLLNWRLIDGKRKEEGEGGGL